jgi:hypothetical protein
MSPPLASLVESGREASRSSRDCKGTYIDIADTDTTSHICGIDWFGGELGSEVTVGRWGGALMVVGRDRAQLSRPAVWKFLEDCGLPKSLGGFFRVFLPWKNLWAAGVPHSPQPHLSASGSQLPSSPLGGVETAEVCCRRVGHQPR